MPWFCCTDLRAWEGLTRRVACTCRCPYKQAQQRAPISRSKITPKMVSTASIPAHLPIAWSYLESSPRQDGRAARASLHCVCKIQLLNPFHSKTNTYSRDHQKRPIQRFSQETLPSKLRNLPRLESHSCHLFAMSLWTSDRLISLRLSLLLRRKETHLFFRPFKIYSIYMY